MFKTIYQTIFAASKWLEIKTAKELCKKDIHLMLEDVQELPTKSHGIQQAQGFCKYCGKLVVTDKDLANL